MSDYKPGDVAMVTAYNRREPYRAYFDGKTWREYDADIFCVDVPTTIRPLVVLDLSPYSPIDAAAILSGAIEATDSPKGSLLRRIRDAVRSQTKPPKPAEPTGLGAVVEDAEGRRWVHFGNGCWIKDVPNASLITEAWYQVDVVSVLSEGVTQ